MWRALILLMLALPGWAQEPHPILALDRMLNSFIAKKDLDSEMTVVRNDCLQECGHKLEHPNGHRKPCKKAP